MDNRLRIRTRLPTVIFFALLVLNKLTLTSLIPFFAAIVHEFGHILIMSLCGQRVKEITLLPFGVDIKKQPCLTSYKTDIWVSSGGIMANAAAIIFCQGLPKSHNLKFFIWSNVVLIIINVLPIKTLDGGQILEKSIALHSTPDKAESIVSACSLVCIILLGSVAIWLLFYSTYNFTLLLMCMYLFCGIFLPKR